MDFSVLLSIYEKEKPEYFAECMDSLLNQSIKPTEIVLVEDGKLRAKLYAYIEKYEAKAEQMGISFKRIALEENRGLGLALAEGIKHCSYELIARMDTDDISVYNRFELQLDRFRKKPSLDIVGGHIREFSGDVTNVLGDRRVPLKQKEICEYQRRRDGFNHVTVMFRKSAVLKAGNYQNCLLMEDSLLWANMIRSHAKMANIDEILVMVRTGDDMIERRGGLGYFKKYFAGRMKIYKTGTISRFDFWYTVLAQFAVCMMPHSLRTFVFYKILRK